MTRVILLTFSLFLSLSLSANDWSYKRLNKLYNSNQEKCLKTAKRYIKLFPKKAASYYFVSVIYFEKTDNARNVRGKYLHMSKALNYAKKFEKINDEDIMISVDWEIYLINLEEKSTLIMVELTDVQQDDLSARLMAKLGKLDRFETIKSIEDVEVTKLEEIGSVPESFRMPAQFYGMASGNEVVRSYSLSHEQDLLKLINAERKKQGMNPLEWEEDLAKACRYHAFDLGSQGYFNHNSYDRNKNDLIEVGGTFERIRKFYNDTFVNSENIAAGNEDVKGTYQQWYTSKGHYDNMFNSSSKKVGIGVCHIPGSPYGYYWVFCTAQ